MSNMVRWRPGVCIVDESVSMNGQSVLLFSISGIEASSQLDDRLVALDATEDVHGVSGGVGSESSMEAVAG